MSSPTPYAQTIKSRRQFLTNTVQASSLGLANRLGVVSALALAASGVAHASEQQDLLRALGNQVATAAIAQIGTPGAKYSVSFLDCASDDLNVIRSGVSEVFGKSLQSLDEMQGYCPASLGIATVTNLDTQRRAIVDIYATSLSLINIAEQRSAFMQMPSSNLYSIQIS